MARNTSDSSDFTVHYARAARDLDQVQEGVVAADIGMANLFLRFAQESAALRSDERRLLELISVNTFLAFPQATHQVLAVRHPETNELEVLIARSRSGDRPPVDLSRRLARHVMDRGEAILFSPGPGAEGASESQVLARIRTAICAPLIGAEDAFGIIQLDIRERRQGLFTGRELDRLAVFAHQAALVLENLRLWEAYKRSVKSSINALVHSLFLKDPETGFHSERVQAISLALGSEFGLGTADMEELGVAALVHDLGKQGVRNDVLLKPGALTEAERVEMNHHSVMTENILDKIVFPPNWSDVPRFAAYHHERMDGRGVYGLKGDEIPIQARIIAVADVFDALISPRVYKQPKSPAECLAILAQGGGTAWDPAVIAALERILPALLAQIYDLDADGRSLHPDAGSELDSAA